MHQRLFEFCVFDSRFGNLEHSFFDERRAELICEQAFIKYRIVIEDSPFVVRFTGYIPSDAIFRLREVRVNFNYFRGYNVGLNQNDKPTACKFVCFSKPRTHITDGKTTVIVFTLVGFFDVFIPFRNQRVKRKDIRLSEKHIAP